MRLLVYYKSGTATDDVLKSLDVLSVNYQATGKAGLANKGGIVAEVAINKTTRLSFLTAHLEAHEGEKHYNARNASLKDILMETGSKYFDASQSSHFSFAMGDLNYRTKLADVEIGSDRHIRLCHTMAGKNAWKTLNKYDELRGSLDKQTCLVGYQTAYCNFPPTFKVERKNGYKYNVKRSPSYTDRILFKKADQLESALQLLLYEPVETFTSSDHKPIRSGFSVRLNRDLKWKSTAQLLHAEDKRLLPESASSVDIFDVIPDTTTGNINADREIMHFFVTNIECSINPDKYDHIRRQEKAELPSPKVMFITNPSDAIQPLDDSSKKKRWFQRAGKKKEDLGGNDDNNGSSTKTTKKTNVKFPSTSSTKDTMRPIWKREHVHFALQTHTHHGRSIDFTGAQLHLSLVDTKTSAVIGSHCLNLAHLIIISRERMISRKKGGLNVESKHKNGGGGLGLRKERGIGSIKNTSTHSSASQTTTNSSRNSNTPGGYQIASRPSAALRSASMMSSVSKFGNEQEEMANPFPRAVQKAADSLRRSGDGASKLFDSIVADLGGVTSGGGGSSSHSHNSTSTNNKGIDEFGITSLRLNESLIEGGLVIGQIKCDLDFWWI